MIMLVLQWRQGERWFILKKPKTLMIVKTNEGSETEVTVTSKLNRSFARETLVCIKKTAIGMGLARK